MSKKNKKIQQELDIAQEYDQAAEIARYFGFTPINTPSYNPEALERIKSLKEDTYKSVYKTKTEETLRSSHLNEKATIAYSYINGWQNFSQTLSIFTPLPFKKGSKKLPKTAEYGIDIIGSGQSIADALLMQTIKSILEEEGFKGIHFEINCIGEKDATHQFEKELNAYFRKNINLLTPDQQKLFKHNVFHLIQEAARTETFIELLKEAPQAMNFLSEAGRKHFKEVLEHLENLNIDYEIDGFLIENKYYSTHTIFAARDKNGTLLALGGRYNNITKKLGTRKDIPAIGATLCYKYTKERKQQKRDSFPKQSFYFMQLGQEAKVKGLAMLEQLRKKKIPIVHSITRDKASSQLGTADNLKLPYIIIIGKKEAYENTVALRESSTRAQKIIGFDTLPKQLKVLQSALAKKKK